MAHPTDPTMLELLALIEKNPTLLKDLQKRAKNDQPLVSKPKVKKPLQPGFVSQVSATCSLCASPHTLYVHMQFDPNPLSMGYKSTGQSSFNQWSDLPLKQVEETLKTCSKCHSVLKTYSNDALIVMLIKTSILINVEPSFDREALRDATFAKTLRESHEKKTKDSQLEQAEEEGEE